MFSRLKRAFSLEQSNQQTFESAATSNEAAQSILDVYVTAPPSPILPFNIFRNEWSSIIPGLGLGSAALFEDGRVEWLFQQCGGLSGKTVLELGPLEGGHSYMMAKAGAARIVGIESNTRAFLKCLIVKNALNFQAEFQLGDFRPYLNNTDDKYDFILACGVLYHMIDPEQLLIDMARVSPRLGLWTHYYDRDVIMGRDDLRAKFADQPEVVRVGKRELKKCQQQYLAALKWKGFCGGAAPTSNWLSRDSLLGLLEDLGYEIKIGQEELDHPNGPCILLYGERECQSSVKNADLACTQQPIHEVRE
jgi:2-polyprenyl-3-methyl-5-hydroxy-6-metoxy-1,4-benzoquinol methylase